MSAGYLSLGIALRHAQKARVVMRGLPAARRSLVNQLAVPYWQIIALIGEPYVDQSVVFIALREAYGIGFAFLW